MNDKKSCQKHVDKCQSNPCVHGTCTDGVNSYTCQCTPGYRGDNCDEDVDECQPNQCVKGTCTDGVNSYTCKCIPGYKGDNCDEDINECQSNPCVHGSCADGVNSYTCQCNPGYGGDNCDEEIILLTLDGAEYDATSTMAYDPKYGPNRAFKRAHYNLQQHLRSFPWISAWVHSISFQDGLSHTVSVTLPLPVTAVMFSFRSRPEPESLHSLNWVTGFSPTQFDFIGSNDCDKIKRYETWKIIV